MAGAFPCSDPAGLIRGGLPWGHSDALKKVSHAHELWMFQDKVTEALHGFSAAVSGVRSVLMFLSCHDLQAGCKTVPCLAAHPLN